MTCGIYLGAPKSNLTDKVYIGQSIEIEARVLRHNAELLKGRHFPKIQEGYNNYGEFSWEIVKECTETELDFLEEYYIKLFDSVENGFNTYSTVYQVPPSYSGINNGNVRIDSIPIYKNILITTISNPTFTLKKVAEMSNTTTAVVDHIWQGGYSWLENLFPEEYRLVRELSGKRQIGGKSLLQQGKPVISILSPSFEVHVVENIRKFAKEYNLDHGDLTNLVNKKVGTVKSWIVKNLDITDPDKHARFYGTARGNYRKQFDLYKSKT